MATEQEKSIGYQHLKKVRLEYDQYMRGQINPLLTPQEMEGMVNKLIGMIESATRAAGLLPSRDIRVSFPSFRVKLSQQVLDTTKTTAAIRTRVAPAKPEKIDKPETAREASNENDD